MPSACEKHNTVYLDYAAACPVLPEIAARHEECCRTYIANPHGTTRFSFLAKQAIRQAERQLLQALSIPFDEAEVIWTSGGTEADNLAALGLLRRKAGSLALVDAGAHRALLEPCRHVAEHEGGRLLTIPLREDGQLDLEQFDEAAAGDAALVGVCQVNNETGVALDLGTLRDWMDRHTPGARLVVDAMQALGKVEIPWTEAGIDLLALSARKVGGPASVGALVLRKGIQLTPLFYGGDQQRGVRPGTLDTVGILEAARAVALTCQRRADARTKAEHLRNTLLDLLATWDGPPVCTISPPEAVPHIVAAALPGYEGAVVMRLLADRGVSVGTGSACSAEAAETSHVLRAMGVPKNVSRSVLRISVGWDNTGEDVHRFVRELRAVLQDY